MTPPMKETVLVLSGGLDSTTLLYHLLHEGHAVKALSINYGQRHSRELRLAQQICQRTGVEHRLVDLAGLSDIFGLNALTSSSVDVPHGEYGPANMAVTVVPNRNMILISIAIGWAIASKFDSVAFGAHTGEYTPYADCQPQFAAAMGHAAYVCDRKPIELIAPFIDWNKSDIVKRGHDLGVPFELTWSCYEGGELHCGQCSTCIDRRRAFQTNSLVDPVKYYS